MYLSGIEIALAGRRDVRQIHAQQVVLLSSRSSASALSAAQLQRVLRSTISGWGATVLDLLNQLLSSFAAALFGSLGSKRNGWRVASFWLLIYPMVWYMFKFMVVDL